MITQKTSDIRLFTSKASNWFSTSSSARYYRVKDYTIVLLPNDGSCVTGEDPGSMTWRRDFRLMSDQSCRMCLLVPRLALQGILCFVDQSLEESI